MTQKMPGRPNPSAAPGGVSFDCGSNAAEPIESPAAGQAPGKSWREVLPVHPAADLFPLMSPDELRALGEDIRENGLASPIALWEASADGQLWLLDGRNRLDGIEIVMGPVVVDRDHSITAGGESVYGYTADILDPADDPWAYVISANIRRRHLTAEQKRDLITKLIKATPEKSNREIARQIKDDHKKVGRVRAALEATGALPQLERTVGKDGKSRTRRPPPLSREDVERIYAERQQRPESEKRRERERDARRMERDQQQRQERARKQERMTRDLASFANNKANREILWDLIDAGFRALAKAAHPDAKGGDGEDMRRLTSARDYLRAVVWRAPT